MTRASTRRAFLNASLAIALLATAPFAARAEEAIQSQPTNTAGIAADILQCKRKDGVLTLRIGFRNVSGAKGEIAVIDGRNYDTYYLVAGNQKYFVLRDSEQTPLATDSGGTGYLAPKLESGETYVFWAKYPAPPEDVKAVSIFTPHTPPFDDVPISD
jgi:hypothetical protein